MFGFINNLSIKNIHKNRPVFSDDDAREFWVCAEDRNHETARCYDELGLAGYEVMEAF